MVVLSVSLIPIFMAVVGFTKTLRGRQSINPCAGLGSYTYSTYPYNFTLAALNRTLPNTEATGEPLFIGRSYYAANSSTLYTPAVLTTLFNSSNPVFWPGPLISLRDGGLYPISPNSTMGAVSGNVSDGGEVGFVAYPDPYILPNPPPIYCIQQTSNSTANASESYPLLAVHGETSNFSMCIGTNPLLCAPKQNNVIYKPVENSTDYYYDTCYPVDLLFAILFIHAVPFMISAVERRQILDPCAGLGNNTVSTPPWNFTLTAYNTTHPNANDTGALLLLGKAASSGSFAVLATYESFPSFALPGPFMHLDNGTLIPYASGSEGDATALGQNVTTGSELVFLLTEYAFDPPFPAAPIYCILNGSQIPSTTLPILAVNGDIYNFSLCANRNTTQTNVVYKPLPNSSTYYYDSCYPVLLHINPLYLDDKN
ncbi:uncharacterized protein FIBRA_02218 [Fibroporia radiculosa]|uniref:Membrane-associated protein n=1 Tax=Fibroporia radiculosa TaxID=599839 RepID=J4GMN1_9APHY|nr:uncharacterized protein FIBRA_02218 [Fibroporia radiculosa]CCM00190.1 predicted protein [Fibroporia radiculosa]